LKIVQSAIFFSLPKKKKVYPTLLAPEIDINIFYYYIKIFITIYSLNFDKLAVEESFTFTDFNNGYGLVMVVYHTQRRWIQLVSCVRFGRAVHSRDPGDDSNQQGASHPQV